MNQYILPCRSDLHSKLLLQSIQSVSHESRTVPIQLLPELAKIHVHKRELQPWPDTKIYCRRCILSCIQACGSRCCSSTPPRARAPYWRITRWRYAMMSCVPCPWHSSLLDVSALRRSSCPVFPNTCVLRQRTFLLPSHTMAIPKSGQPKTISADKPSRCPPSAVTNGTAQVPATSPLPQP